MGAREKTSANVTYYNPVTSEGAWATRVKDGTEGAKERVLKDGSKVHERYYNEIYGYLTAVREREFEYAGAKIPVVEIMLRDTDDIDHYDVITFQRDSSALNRILLRLPLVELQKPVSFSCYKVYDKEKSVHKFITEVLQGDIKIPPRYTRDNMEDCPLWEKVKIKGKEEWDSYEQTTFLLNKIRSLIEVHNQGSAPVVTAPVADAPVSSDDDLPF